MYGFTVKTTLQIKLLTDEAQHGGAERDDAGLFGLSAQLTIRAIAKVVKAYKRDKSKQCFFKPTGAVVYDQRIVSFKGLEKASLLTLQGRAVIPMQMGGYQRA
jgi:hypothetical protein